MSRDLKAADAGPRDPSVDVDASIANTGRESVDLRLPCVARCTLLTTESPACVSKVFSYENGVLRRQTVANVSRGDVQVIAVPDLQAFGELLVSVRNNQCLLYGVGHGAQLKLMTNEAWGRAGRPSDAISRTETCLRWPDGRAFLMLDHDPKPGMPTYTAEDLVAALRDQVPEAADADMLTYPSASSLIFNRETGECLKPLSGIRVYLMVERAADIPAYGKYIDECLWAGGHGVFTVSRSGQLRACGLFDTSVWQASRIDFVAGAICKPPLEQRRGLPKLHRGRDRCISRDFPTLGPQQRTAVLANKSRARDAVATQGRVAREQYIEDRAAAMTRRANEAGQSPVQAAGRARYATEAMLRTDAPELNGEVGVFVELGDGHVQELDVAEILRRRQELDGAMTLDPLEPEYDGRRLVGKLFLRGPVARLHSFAHGGATYKLVAQMGSVECEPGGLAQSVHATLDVLRACGDVLECGSELVTPTWDGRLCPVTQLLMPFILSTRASFFRSVLDKRTEELKRREMHPPKLLCDSLFDLRGHRSLPRLEAVITAPILVGDRVIDQPGYDEQTGLLLALPPDAESFCSEVSVADAKRAFHSILDRLDSFPFETLYDRGVLVAALLTAVLRPALRAAPGFAFDAPAQGTGKSLLAECVAIVGTGALPGTVPHIHDNEDEVRKQLFSLLYEGSLAMIWDNVKGSFDSTTLASMLTSSQFKGRVLGKSRTASMPNRMLALFTGNNVSLRGELTRRVLICRLNARRERPYLRHFTANPRDACLADRQAMVRELLTVAKAYQLHAEGFAQAISLGSFEEWSAAVLRPVLWAIALFGEGRVGDPLAKIASGEADDEELELLEALHKPWYAKHGSAPKTAKQIVDDAFGRAEVHKDMDDDEDESLKNAVVDFVGDSRRYMTPTECARALGRQLSYRKDRVFNGCRSFRKHKQAASGGVAKWIAFVDEELKA